MFGLTYAFSVFTHLPEVLQRPWLQELARVTRPRGYLLLSLHGEAYVHERFSLTDQERFRRGELVVRNPELANTSDQYARCGAYHPPSYVREQLAHGLEILAHRPGRVTDPVRRVATQDVWLFRT
ncbi:MAG: class I SAM-dependent methyltransferase, partial [Candidatus Rokuibacteriota bacterium]